MKYIERSIKNDIVNSLNVNPVTAIIGARQTGKSTLSKHILEKIPNSIYLDLEKPSDLLKLDDPEAYFDMHKNKLICIDEIQRKKELFPIIRSIVDERNQNKQFLILGSASPELLRQSSESLAGRISYFELTPFLLNELNSDQDISDYLFKGGFPRSLFFKTTTDSFNWRINFIRTFLERDVRNLGFTIPPETLNRLWKMLAHLNGQLLNYSQLGNSLGVTHTTAKNYVDILQNTFMLRILQPYHANLKKRLVKSPKIYIKDPGILCSLLNLQTFEDLYSHPVYGNAWEGMVIEHIIQKYHDWDASFYRTSNGNEVDLLLTKGNTKIAIECKSNKKPSVPTGLKNAIKDLNTDKTYIIAPVNETFPIKGNIIVTSLVNILKSL